MPIERIYDKYLDETASTVRVNENGKYRVLQRNRMYNSHLDHKGFLYTDYHDREYQQHKAAANPDRPVGPRTEQHEKHSERAKRGWEARRARQG